MIDENSPFIDRLIEYIDSGAENDLSNNMFEGCVFFVSFIVYLLLYIAFFLLTLLTAIIWGPIFIVVKIIRDHRKRQQNDREGI